MGFLITLFGPRKKSSAQDAKDRLLEVLIHDRIKLPPATMEQIRQEIIAVLSKYIDVDQQGMEVSLTRMDGADQLTANIPIRRGDATNFMKVDDEEPSARPPKPKGPASATTSTPAAARTSQTNFSGAQRKRDRA